jgi:hypothetical protein
MGEDRRSAALDAQADTILSWPAEGAPAATLAGFQAALAEKGHRFSLSAVWWF